MKLYPLWHALDSSTIDSVNLLCYVCCIFFFFFFFFLVVNSSLSPPRLEPRNKYNKHKFGHRFLQCTEGHSQMAIQSIRSIRRTRKCGVLRKYKYTTIKKQTLVLFFFFKRSHSKSKFCPTN